jgi:amino acid adenylation domain-containing protein
MLYDALRLGRNAGYDIEQLHLVLDEQIDTGTLSQAFQWVTRRHSALHTEFRWDENGRPLQRIAAHATLPVEVEDWSRIPPPERASLLASFLDADRRRGFEMSQAPLGRVRILRIGSNRTEVIWTLHHIVIDAASLPLALLDVFAVYEQLRNRNQPSLGDTAPAYRSYIEWLCSLDLSRSRQYFSDLLAGALPPPTLPGAALATANVPPKPEVIVRHVGQEALRLARSLASRTGTTLETVVHAVWALVLARHSASGEDIVFGSTRACRRSPAVSGVENMIGLLANTLPVRARMGTARTVQELLQDLRSQTLALREHEHMPLFEIEHPGSQKTDSLLNTTVTFQRASLIEELRKRGGDAWRTRFCTLYEQPIPPLNLKAIESDQLELCLLFDAARLDRHAIERLADSLVFTLGEISTDEHRAIDDLPVLPPEIVNQILFEWNRTSHPAPEQVLIHELFEGWVDKQPDAIAVEAGESRLTYRQLDEASNRVAHALHSKGIGPGRFTAICLNRGVDLVIAMLGAAKSGASYVPLDPRYPPHRLSFMLQDSGCNCVLTEPAFAELFTNRDPMYVAQIVGDALIPAVRPAGKAAPRDICYAIYTSGTTGNPNGVLLSHRAVVNTLDWVNHTFEVGPGDRALFVTSPCFDLSVYDVFGVLGAGATVVVASDAQLRNPDELAAALESSGITMWNSAPATLDSMLALTGTAVATLSRLRLVLLSGDWIPLSLPDAVRKKYRGARVISLGGATEAAIWSNWFPVGKVESDWTSIPYGVPIQNCRYHVLDGNMRPVPIGVPGDLYIGGTCLAEGYLNRPELTAQRFVKDPFTDREGGRLYKSGDRALYHEGGQIRLLGRQDSQIKIRGVRVELGEIEAALLKIPGVKQGVAMPYIDGSGQKAVGAYVVLDKQATLDGHAIRQMLSATLTIYAVPTRITLLETLPLSANGKVDRKALPRMDERVEPGHFVAPRTAAERQMVELWQELLQRRPIGITDDFFALGGHSLLAVTLMSRVRAQFGWDVPIERLIAHPTIQALLAARDESASSNEPKHFLVFNPQGTRTPIVLVPGVYGTLFVFRELPKRFGPDQPVYLATAFSTCEPGDNSEPSVERMAEACEAELLQICRRGPIVLGGLSCGMLIAFELAHRLAKKGIDVPLLVSLDGFAPGYPEYLPRGQRLMAHVREFTSGDRKRYLLDRVANTRRRFMRLLGREHELHAEVLSASPEVRRMLKRTFEMNLQASRHYHPNFRYSGKLLLFRAERPERWVGIKGLDALHGWGDFIEGEGRISVVILPGDHGAILDESNQHVVVRSVVEHLQNLRYRDSITVEMEPKLAPAL